jgi:hypothetical protein
MTTRSLPVIPPFQVGEDLYINILAKGDPRIALNKKVFLPLCSEDKDAESVLDYTPVYVMLVLQSYKADKIHGIAIVQDIVNTTEYRANMFCGSEKIPDLLKGIEQYVKTVGGTSLILSDVDEKDYIQYGYAKNEQNEVIKQLGGRRRRKTRRSHLRKRRVTRRRL